MKWKNLKMAFGSFFFALLLTIGTITVYAAVVEGSWGEYGPVNGYYYQNKANCYSRSPYSTSGVFASSVVAPQYGGTCPAGYEGLMARLYNNSGYLINSSSWYFNSSEASSMEGIAPSYYTGGNYYSHGITAAYNGNGYNYYYTFKSPVISY
ncbi:MAG: hypothetical protein ABFD04_05375 [Syntrophomonas sp.]